LAVTPGGAQIAPGLVDTAQIRTRWGVYCRACRRGAGGRI